MDRIEPLSVVALLEDVPSRGLLRGQVCTVVEVLAPDVFEVEFIDNQGRTYGCYALNSNQLIRVHHEPVPRAA